MIQCYEGDVFLLDGKDILQDGPDAAAAIEARCGRRVDREEARRGTMAAGILESHNRSDDPRRLSLRFDSLASHDITYVGIIQTARASGMERFPLPYVLTNCHNALCAVGGTINEDDHAFALSAARRYGGIYLPPHQAVIHAYNREMMAGVGRMILASDSHTRYGALGTMGIGEGGGELAKQLCGRAYELARPEVVAVYLTGTPQPGVGPHDVALAIIGAVYRAGTVKNKVMEFVGDGIAALPVDFRNGIDVMTTEAACLSSIWVCDARVADYYALHGRPEDYRPLAPAPVACYDGLIRVDLSQIRPMIALPFHPANVYPIAELQAHPREILGEVEARCRAQFPGVPIDLLGKVHDGGVWAEQGIIAGCAGGSFDNLMAAAGILRNRSIGAGVFSMSVYPESQPTYLELIQNGAAASLMEAGVILRSAFCGPCFGAGDTPANGALSIRHTTRNFPNREGSKPGEGQLALVALMDARSIAATAKNGGRITAATEEDVDARRTVRHFDRSIYRKRVYDGWGHADPRVPLRMGPNIRDWPVLPAMAAHLLVKVVSELHDPVTTTDELIPSGETSSFRSNPLRLAEFTLSRRDPAYVGEAKAVAALTIDDLDALYGRIQALDRTVAREDIGIGSALYANCPGDGSAREQAASCQRVLGGSANIALAYATKRYRSNLLNWGMLPLVTDDEHLFHKGDWLLLPHIRRAIAEGAGQVEGYLLTASDARPVSLSLGELTAEERRVLLAGCLINDYRASR